MLSAERVRAGLVTTRFRDVRILDRVDSTNRVARDLARQGAPEGLVVVAGYQSAGRGRLGRTWEAPAGSSILASVLLRPDLPVTRWSLVSAAVALSARHACSAVAGFCPDLKWPNDLLVGDAKLAGILAEASLGAVVAGIGLNVSASPPGAAHVNAVADRPVDGGDLLVALLVDLDTRVRRWERVMVDYRAACVTIGQDVRVTTSDGDLLARATAVDDQGRLVVLPPGGTTVVLAAGDVTHLRRR